MPTPIGHALVGATLWAAGRRLWRDADRNERRGLLGLAMVAALAPDLDFIHADAGGIAVSGLYHHGLTHSLGFALAAGLLIWGYGAMRGYAGAGVAGGLVAAAWASHGIVDLFYDDGFILNGYGLPLFWPVTGDYYILALLPPVDRSAPLAAASLAALGLEIVVYGALFLAARRGRPRVRG